MIPYAWHAKDARGRIRPNAVVCPVCSKTIVLRSKKDCDSYSTNEYAAHYASEHASEEKR